MKLYTFKVEDDDPNDTLVTWLSNNQSNYKIRTIILREEDSETQWWHVYYVD
jgi:hypothetical protein